MLMFTDHSLPKLLNLKEKPKSEDNKAMIPVEKYRCPMYVNGIVS